MLRIAQVTPYYSPHLGGVETYVRQVSRIFREKGHEVTIVTSRHLPDLPAEETVDGCRVVRVPPRMTLFTTPVTPRIADVLRQGTFDIIHAHAPPPLTSYYAAKAARATATPLVYTYHCDLELPGAWGDLVTGLYRRTLGRSTLRAARRIIVTTETYAHTSRAVWNYPVTVIPVGVDPTVFRPDAGAGTGTGAGAGAATATADLRRKLSDGSNGPLVLFVGRLTHHKGVDQLLEATAHLPDDVRTVIVGDGPHRTALERRAAELHLGSRARFVGSVTDHDLPHYFAACDVFVLPSVSRLEAFGIATLEAMATGRPVIAPDMPGPREAVDDGVDGLLAEPLDPGDLAAKIQELLRDPARRAEMGRRGREKVERRYTWQHVASEILKVYARALPAKGGRRHGARHPAAAPAAPVAPDGGPSRARAPPAPRSQG